MKMKKVKKNDKEMTEKSYFTKDWGKNLEEIQKREFRRTFFNA